jgi:hypothetical protein
MGQTARGRKRGGFGTPLCNSSPSRARLQMAPWTLLMQLSGGGSTPSGLIEVSEMGLCVAHCKPHLSLSPNHITSSSFARMFMF